KGVYPGCRAIRFHTGIHVRGKLGIKQTRPQFRGLESPPPKDYLIAIVPGHSYGCDLSRFYGGIKDRCRDDPGTAVRQVNSTLGISRKLCKQLCSSDNYVVGLAASMGDPPCDNHVSIFTE